MDGDVFFEVQEASVVSAGGGVSFRNLYFWIQMMQHCAI